MFGKKTNSEYFCEVNSKSYIRPEVELNFLKKHKLSENNRSPLEKLRLILSFVPDFSSLDSILNLSIDENHHIPIFNKSLNTIPFNNSFFDKFKNNSNFKKLFSNEIKDLLERYEDTIQTTTTQTTPERRNHNYLSYQDTGSEHLLACHNTKECYDCTFVSNSEKIAFSRFSNNCKNSYFLENCTNCSHCLFCTNLKDASYHIFNKEMSKEDYESTLSSLLLWERSHLDNAKERFASYLKTSPFDSKSIYNSKNISGRFISNSSNCFSSFLIFNSINTSSSFYTSEVKNCFNSALISFKAENIYNSSSIIGPANNIICSHLSGPNINNLYYSFGCKNSSNLLGCVALDGKEYCIFNQQLDKKNYEKMFSFLQNSLILEEAWGSSMSFDMSLIPYNLSLANSILPLGKIQAELLRATWKDLENNTNIDEDTEICEISAERFKIKDYEYDLCKSLGITVPDRSPNQKLKEKLVGLEIGEEKTIFSINENKDVNTFYKGNRIILK